MMLIILDESKDDAFLKKNFRHQLEDVDKQMINIAVKIVQIHPMVWDHDAPPLTIDVVDAMGEHGVLVLWMHQVLLAQCIAKGDTLYLKNAAIQGGNKTMLQLSVDTHMFLIPFDKSLEIITLSQKLTCCLDAQKPLEKNDEGIIDLQYYTKRLYIKDIPLYACHITLFGRLLTISENVFRLT